MIPATIDRFALRRNLNGVCADALADDPPADFAVLGVPLQRAERFALRNPARFVRWWILQSLLGTGSNAEFA
jgi:hypothetical protein